MCQLLTTPQRIQLRQLALGDVGMRNDGTTFRHVQRYHGNREPALVARPPAGILHREAFSCPAHHRLDPDKHLAEIERPFTGGAAAYLEIARAHDGLWRPTIFTGESHPAVIDDGDPALTIQHGDVAA